MLWYRFVVPNWEGRRIVGDWIKDVPFYVEQAAKIWISRGVTFTVEFRQE